MSTWEAPPPPRRRRRSGAVVVGVCLLAIAAAVLTTAGPTGQLAVETATSPSAPAPRTGDGVWPPPWPGLWRVLPRSPLTPRIGHAFVATGRQLFVWGGADLSGRPLTDGAVFDLGTGSWRRLPGNGARNSRVHAVWTGVDVVTVSTTETRRYDPRAGTWRTAARVPRPRGLILSGHVRAAGSTVVTLLVAADGTGASAVFALDQGAGSWRRLPDPPLTLQPDDLLVADAERLLVAAPGRGARAGTVMELPLGGASGWAPLPAPPDFTTGQVGRLSGVLDDGRVVLWATGPGADGGGPGSWVAVREVGRWTRVDAGSVRPSRLIDLAPTGDGVLVWDRVDGRGALLRWGDDRWTRVFPAPLEPAAPRPAAWTGSGVAVWGGFDGSGAVFTPR